MGDSEKKSNVDISLMPYCDISSQYIERLVKRNSGVSISDIRNFIIWLFTLESIPPTWIFVGNKPLLTNVTLFIANEDDVINLETVLKENPNIKSIPVRKTPVPDIWDQYLLYGIQRTKRTADEITNMVKQSESHLSYLSMCLTEEERQNNNYMVVKEKQHRANLAKDGYLFVDFTDKDYKKVKNEDDLLIAIDCEMVETKGGRDELARISMLSRQGLLLDEYVLPEGEVVDYRTQYSGITPDILKKCKNNFKDIQYKVYSILSKAPSIVVGHSLENDLSVLKIVHTHVIDTAVRYVHPTAGYKHALRYLTTNYLNRSIQNKNGGHNSIEDARAALDLTVLYASGGEAFKRSFHENRPFASKQNSMLRQIGEANPKMRIVFLGWNDYVMSVSQTSCIGDMMMMKSYDTAITKLCAISHSAHPAKFIYVHGIEYHYQTINETTNKKAGKIDETNNPFDIHKLITQYKSNFQNGLLCVLLMKKTFTESPIAGQFIVMMNSDNQ